MNSDRRDKIKKTASANERTAIHSKLKEVFAGLRKEGQTLLGSPVIDAKQYIKAYALFKRAAEQQ